MSKDNKIAQNIAAIVFFVFSLIGFITIQFIYSTNSIGITVILFVLQIIFALAIGMFFASISVSIVRRIRTKKL